mmetsp:Transcript_34725/g.98580  ORF Transcript_34725/g.98580 Transcript_34725/m.98580 type:complete len:230 (-) Transcript_34725:81-770(-)
MLFSVTRVLNGLPLLVRASSVREGGYACSTTFDVDLSAKRVFQLLQRISASGSLDPGCDVCWSAPVDVQAGTWIRHLFFSSFFGNQHFQCICRCARVQPGATLLASEEEALESVLPQHGSDPADPREKYVFAVTSLSSELLNRVGLSSDSAEEGLVAEKRSRIHICGLVISALHAGGARVEVMADVDLAMELLPSRFTDKKVRQHVLHVASKIQKEVQVEKMQRDAGET